VQKIAPFGGAAFADHWSFFGSWWLNGFLNNNAVWFDASAQVLPFVFAQGWASLFAPSLLWAFGNAFQLGAGGIFGASMNNLVDQTGYPGANGG
jgi:hypothetical protein